MRTLVFFKGIDVLVGIITGAICSVVAAVVETVMAALRVFPLGHIGAGFGDKLALVALIGAVFGALVAVALGTFVQPREEAR